tara:strand:+ start:10930 stop:11739 length:810 start_codon:yes stop_codon:yes gene_type:complete
MFSIIIPTYNQSTLLRKCLESIINQTYKKWEAIIINNYSKDETINIIESFKDPRIKYKNFRNNGIIAASRNLGISLSKFPYISFLDSDDIWFPNKLEKVISYLEHKNDIVCHSEIWKWSDGTTKLVNYGPEISSNYENLLFKGNVISTSAVSLKRNLIIEFKGFNQSPFMTGNEDYDLWMRISKEAKYKFKFLNEPLGYYNIHNNNTSKNLLKQLRSEIFVINTHFYKYNLNQITFKRIRLFMRIFKAILGTLLKINESFYKILIKIRK